MYYQVLNTPSEYRQTIQNAISVYEKEKKRIEYLSLSISTDDKTDIMDYFEKLIPRLLYQNKFGTVDFAGVVVDRQHLHFLIRKPFVLLEGLKSSWQQITGKESNIMIKTVKYDMDGHYKYDKILEYTLLQSDHHDGKPVQYVRSPYWGIVIHKKRDQTKKPVPFRIAKKQFKFEESYMIDGKFVSKEEFDKFSSSS